MTFDDGECYCLMLAVELFCDEYRPATAGEDAHLRNTEAVQQRLHDWYDDRRIAAGVTPVYRRAPRSISE